MSSCVFKPETTDHHFLHYKLFSDLRIDLLNSVFSIYKSLKTFSAEELVNVLLYGSEKFTFSANTKIIRHTIKILKAPIHFDILLS